MGFSFRSTDTGFSKLKTNPMTKFTNTNNFISIIIILIFSAGAFFLYDSFSAKKYLGMYASMHNLSPEYITICTEHNLADKQPDKGPGLCDPL